MDNSSGQNDSLIVLKTIVKSQGETCQSVTSISVVQYYNIYENVSNHVFQTCLHSKSIHVDINKMTDSEVPKNDLEGPCS